MPRLETKTVTDGAPPLLAPALASAAERRRLSGPGLRTFLAIAEEWGLGEPERLLVLGAPARSTYYNWVAAARSGREFALPFDTLIRISAVLGIYKALKIVFERGADGYAWLRAPNDGLLFGGQAPIALISAGTQDGLMLVRRHLDAWRGGRYAAPLSEEATALPPLGGDDIVFID